MGQMICGIGSSIISHWITFAVFYIVVYLRSFNIIKYYNKIVTSSVIHVLPTLVLHAIADIPENAHPRLLVVVHFSFDQFLTSSIYAVYELSQKVQASGPYGSRASNQHPIKADDLLSYSSGNISKTVTAIHVKLCIYMILLFIK